MDEFPNFFNILKKKVLYEYVTQIRKPLLKLKQQDIQQFENRADFQQVLALRNYDELEVLKLIDDEIQNDDSENNITYELQKLKNIGRKLDSYGNHTFNFFKNHEANMKAI